MENYNNEEESITKEYDSKLMKRLLKFAKPYKWYIILSNIYNVNSNSYGFSSPIPYKECYR